MKVPITRFRQDMFKLVDSALAGEPLEFVHKGIVFRVIPEGRSSKLAKLTPQPVLAPQADLAQSSHDLLKEMETDWEKDWSQL